MLYVFAGREQILDFLPPGGNIVEIGVANGDFSNILLKKLQPKQLHLIDPWRYQEVEDYIADANNVSDGEQEKRYKYVIERFRAEIDASQVVVHRSLSDDVADEFEDNYFDLIYIDARHTYQAVLDDLNTYRSKLKKGGILAGHDFTGMNGDIGIQCAVSQAVSTFLSRSGFRFFALTSDPGSSFFLGTPGNSGYQFAFIKNILDSGTAVVELNDHMSMHYSLASYVKSNGEGRLIPSFQIGMPYNFGHGQ